ncbi:hypothetical protein CHARACLAT_026703, partial [Characodon lateralis]|nr:hypothetical protein [Characodon lateralis]
VCLAVIRLSLFKYLLLLYCPRRGRDSLPTFRQFFSSAFSLTYVSLASMKVPPDSLRVRFLEQITPVLTHLKS